MHVTLSVTGAKLQLVSFVLLDQLPADDILAFKVLVPPLHIVAASQQRAWIDTRCQDWRQTAAVW